MIFHSCIDQEKISEEKIFYIETINEIKTSDYCVIIGGGSLQFYTIYNDKYIYKVIFDAVRWSTSKGLVNKDISNPYTSERLIFDKCNTDLSEVYAAYSFNSVVQLDSFQLDSITVFKIPDL